MNTTLAFVHTKEDGDREFSFYRNPGADMMLCGDDLDMGLLSDCKIFHYGSLSMTHEGVRRATCKAIDYARANGALISFDPICGRLCGMTWRMPGRRSAMDLHTVISSRLLTTSWSS